MGEMVGISMNETMVLFFSNVVNFDSPTSDSGTKELIVNERTSYYILSELLEISFEFFLAETSFMI